MCQANSASATQFQYDLHNHPDGNASPPPYGLRLDELFDLTAGTDVFTFDFDHPSASMSLIYDDGGTPGDGALVDDTVTILGTVFGGHVNAGAYGDPDYVGLWDVLFEYTTHFVSAGAGGVDVEISPNSVLNAGTLTPQFMVGNPPVAIAPIDLVDKSDGSASFRFNNTEDHRLGGHGLSGPETFVGWGWLIHPGGDDGSQDWLFVATVPEPGTGSLLALAGLGLAALRRRRAA